MAIRYPAICLVGDPEDANLAWLALRARQRGFRVVELAEARLGLEWDISQDDANGARGRIELPTERLATEELAGFVVRLAAALGRPADDAPTRFAPVRFAPPAEFAAARQACLVEWLNAIAGVVVNRPNALKLQPSTLTRLSGGGFDTPLLHSNAPGRSVRVHTVADRAFGTEIMLPAGDGTTDSYRMQRPCSIPEAVADLCCRAAATERLWLASFDLRVTPDDEWVCVGMNPTPDVVTCERATGQPITDAVLDVFEARALVVMAQAEARRAEEMRRSRAGRNGGVSVNGFKGRIRGRLRR